MFGPESQLRCFFLNSLRPGHGGVGLVPATVLLGSATGLREMKIECDKVLMYR